MESYFEFTNNKKVYRHFDLKETTSFLNQFNEASDTTEFPKKIVNIIKCQNPACITTEERDLDQVFNLTDKTNRIYRCKYCEARYKEEL